MRTSWRAVYFLAGLALLAPASQADILNVPGEYATIQAAVDAAQPGDEIVVAAGTYSDPTHPAVDGTLCCVIMKSDITLRGSGMGATIIDPLGLGRGIHVQDVTGCEVYDLTIRNADAEVFGTAIFMRHGDATLQRVELTENLYGGIAIVDTSSVSMLDCQMTYNTGKAGAGLDVEADCSAYVYNCDIIGNTGPASGGVQLRGDVTMEHCRVLQNGAEAAAGVYGGGIGILSGNPTIRYCVIKDNFSGYGGGGLFIVGDFTTGLVEDCWISGNSCAGDEGTGGGILVNSFATPTIRRCIFTDNRATGQWGGGGGVSIEFANVTMENCTVFANYVTGSEAHGGNFYMYALPEYNDVQITHTIIAGATQGEGIYCFSGSEVIDISCSDVWGNAGGDALCGTGADNFSADPLFCNAAGGNFHIDETSPCAPGNHPGGAALCGGALIGAEQEGCDSGVDDTPLVAGPRLLENRPNPFDRGTLISFELAAASDVSLEVFDPSGRRVALLHSGPLAAGEHAVAWDGSDASGTRLGSGVYLCRLRAGEVARSLRMLHLE